MIADTILMSCGMGMVFSLRTHLVSLVHGGVPQNLMEVNKKNAQRKSTV